jgi:hypothetical protein
MLILVSCAATSYCGRPFALGCVQRGNHPPHQQDFYTLEPHLMNKANPGLSLRAKRDAFYSNITAMIRCLFIAGAATLLLAGCGDGGALPDYDKNATYNGKPLSDYAEGLSDLNARQRFAALGDIAKFGVNGLPARKQIQQLVREDEDHMLRIAALGVLHNMKDPGLPALYAEILADPEFTTLPGAWRDLARGAGDVFSDEDIQKQMKSIASKNLEHAELLFSQSSGSKLEALLASILMTKKKASADTLQKIVAALPQLDLSEGEKIDFLLSNKDKFTNQSIALSGLQAIGGEKAFSAAMKIVRADSSVPFINRLGAITAFGRSVGVPNLIDELSNLAKEPNLSDAELQQVFSSMGAQLNILGGDIAVRQRKVDDPAYATYAVAAKNYTSVLADLTESPAPTTRALAATYLIQVALGSVTQPALDLETSLGIVFALLETEQEEVVLGTITQQLVRPPAGVLLSDSPALAANFAAAIYARNANNQWAYAVGEGVIKAIDVWFVHSKFERAELIRLVTDQAKANEGHPANARVFDWITAMTRNQMIVRTLADDDITDIAGRAGSLALDSAVTQAQIEKFFSGANPGNLTIATQAPSTDAIIAFAEPMVMSQDPKFTGRNAQSVLGGVLSTNIYYLRGHADQPRYIAWVKKVAQEGHPALRTIAVKGLRQYAK